MDSTPCGYVWVVWLCIQACKKNRDEWTDGYRLGAGNEIYVETFSSAFAGMTFTQAAEWVHWDTAGRICEASRVEYVRHECNMCVTSVMCASRV